MILSRSQHTSAVQDDRIEGLMPSVGERCTVSIPVADDDDTDPRVEAARALRRACEHVGLTATEVRFVRADRWTEPVDGLPGWEPRPHITWHVYETTAS